MSECERHQPAFEAYVAGELDEGALGPLLVHARGCEDCRRLLELHRDLAVLAARAPRPGEAELEAIEAGVLRRLAPIRGRSRAVLGRIPRVAAALAASLLLFAAGLAAGRAVSGAAGRGGGADVIDRLISAMRADAAGNRAMTDVEDSRFAYSNVSFRRVSDGRLALDFDVTTRVRLVEPAGSDLLQDLLVQSLVGSASTGTRLKAAELASAAAPKTKEALLFAMRRDESLAVRLGALAALAGRLHDADVEAAMLATLREDPAVQMRLLALDALAAHDADRDLVRQAIREGPRPGGEALEVRLAAYEQRL